jgi:uncharacterized repeat protein (TIGR03809 family)
MTTQLDVAHGRDVLVRWCDLAEARLEYLTQLFETCRWRRYYTELSFLENIQEAKTAVETWRGLSNRATPRNNSAIDLSSRIQGAPLPRGETPRVQPMWSEPPGLRVLTAAESELVFSDRALAAPELDEPELDQHDLDAPLMEGGSLDLSELTRGIAAAIAERYPQLHNAM